MSMISRDWQSQRRIQAVTLFYDKGWQQNLIAEALGVTKGAISQWVKRVKDKPREDWAELLAVKVSTGRPPKLTKKQQKQVAALVERGAESFGFIGDVWTLARIQKVAGRELGIQVGLGTIRKALLDQGFSNQKPQVVSSQKNPAQVSGFRGGWQSLKRGQSEGEPEFSL